MSIPTTEAEIAAVFAPSAKFSLGCMFAQVCVDSFFCGVLTMQGKSFIPSIYSYFKYQRRDSWWIKSVVITTAIINLVVTIYLWYFISYLFVQNFGLWSPFAETKYLAWFPFLDSLNSAVVQAFFAYRAYRLCNRMWIIPLVCGVLILTSVGATLAVLILFSSFASLFQADGVTVPELIWLSSIMSADIIITISILFGLWRSKTGWSHTDRVITRLIRMTLESQVPPTIIAITFMVEFVQTPSSLFGSTLQGIQPKLYAVGLMYALNARITFQQQWVGDKDRTGGQVFAMSNRPTQKTQLQVDVETETYVQSTPAYTLDERPGLNRGPYDTMEDKKSAEDLQDLHVNAEPGVYGSRARLTAH
ncbi:hypothetical protein BD324DRAFT_679539 [Kockovaella imperatae]|uniref:DUF6534 domain-containing protein n=1 Tax=Kockovaella imperatae TaxID=4999 RepID=A0A1Y1UNH3_9TREE|nr:hypothetical protein BD324DRAFT_679539 [Kockovaella imperatae]ORX39034.1 hypothetical protein BD324DRAFT_679539 [Kockovaella imperatae]